MTNMYILFILAALVAFLTLSWSATFIEILNRVTKGNLTYQFLILLGVTAILLFVLSQLFKLDVESSIPLKTRGK